MKRSTDRILTTHVGSLIRPPELQEFLRAKQSGKPYDEAAYQACLKKTVAEVMHENVWVTTSGNFSAPALRCTVDILGIDRVMFSVDWPYESNKIAVAFLENLDLAAEDLEKLAHGNAERLLKL